jgi:cold shock CspA family protein
VNGIVKNFFAERSVGLITSDNGVEYFVARKWIQADPVTGRKYLIRGELVTFDGVGNEAKRRNDAVNVVPLNRPPEEVDKDHFETCVIVRFNGTSGFLSRPYPGEEMFFHKNSIRTYGPRMPGTKVECQFEQISDGRWHAVNIHILKPEYNISDYLVFGDSNETEQR